MSAEMAWWAALLATDAPALPGALWVRYYLPVSWFTPFLLLGALIAWKLSPRKRYLFASFFAFFCVADGSAFPAYWLGLAFQALSYSAVFVCALAYGAVVQEPGKQAARQGVGVSMGFLLVAVLPGYLLLLDTFAVLPWQIYAWGFSPLALLCLLAVSLLPGVLSGFRFSRHTPEVWVAPAALLLFAATRLPTGNAWDALSDPWLWLFLNGVLFRKLYRHLRGARVPAQQA